MSFSLLAEAAATDIRAALFQITAQMPSDLISSSRRGVDSIHLASPPTGAGPALSTPTTDSLGSLYPIARYWAALCGPDSPAGFLGPVCMALSGARRHAILWMGR
jgi:hypothetical protein